ncbi:TonB-dependent receptor [Sphingomonas sp. DG1-23]|uniref:TonB-dependent receptor plug domain-containing protein n=1 Tax=Sphingomonas sp. DG1-23 TaxID=3068316 RepID=UPI00273FEEB1|nr:TonB-dependent receptor [Sphingomonas sp. DG1-23]MDP5280732.1 TonB-dependent receptor [Sphingomonas sp. DG1-23]
MAYSVLRTRGLFTVSAAALALACAPAWAQTAAPGQSDDNVPESTVANDPQSDQAEEPAPDIVVTGSRIRVTPGFDTPNPVVSIGSETLQASGTTNLTDFLTGYPALQGSSTSADNSGSGAGIGYTGLNLLNLRNLGTERTLVLVDGRRHVAGVPGSAAIDINTIPNDLVQRIEVLTGGASAIYGADGVTGVVNFILKKDFDGITARAQAGISEHGDAGQRFISVTAGKNFAGGRGNVALAYEYGIDDRLETRDRPSLRGTRSTGFFLNPDDPENQGGYTGPADNGIPDNVPLANIRYFDTNREGGIDIDQDGFPDYLVGANGAVTPFDPGSFVPNFYQQGGNATLVSDYGNDLLPKVERHVVNAVAHFDVSDAVTIFAEGKYANIRSFSLAQPTFDYYLLIPEDNPFIPAALQPLVAAEGLGGVLVNRDNFDFGQRGEDIRRETWRGVIGLRGELSSHLNYEASYTYGRTDVRSRYVNDILDDRFYAAIDVVQGPNGPTCRVNVDPAWTPNQPYNSTRDEFPPTTFQPGQCVPINLFGENRNSQAALDWILTDTTDRSRIEQHVASAYLSGDLGGLFTLPGGAVGFSVGAEYRKEKSSFTPDPLAAAGLTFTNALSVDAGEYDVKEVFGELRVPLVKNGFVHRLEVGGAVRYSDYSTIGSTTSWKVDGAFAPIRDVTFTGTYSKAVRAPNIGELFAGNSQTFEFITDPCNANELQNGTQYRAANCQALLASLGVADPATFTDPRSTNLPGFQGGNRNLSEEEATTWTAGAIIQPSFVPGLSLRADWYDIKLKNAINTVTPEQLAQLCVDQPDLNNGFCSGIVRNNGGANPGLITSFTVTPQNVAQFSTAGLDVNFNYRLRTAKLGTFNLSVVGNYLDRLEFVGTPGADVTNSRGEAFAPKYTVNADLTWQTGGLTLNYGILWFSKTLRFTNQEVAGNPDIVAPEYMYLKERWQHDIYASYDVSDRFQIYGGVRNLWGQRPDIGTNTYPVDSIGRFGFVGARVKLPSL